MDAPPRSLAAVHRPARRPRPFRGPAFLPRPRVFTGPRQWLPPDSLWNQEYAVLFGARSVCALRTWLSARRSKEFDFRP